MKNHEKKALVNAEVVVLPSPVMLRAIYYAVGYTAAHHGFREVWWRFSGMILTWWSSRRSVLPTQVVASRREACELCPLFCWELQTCGDYRKPQLWHNQTTGRTEPMGCGCFIPSKSKLSEATCWLDDQSVEPLRWPN